MYYKPVSFTQFLQNSTMCNASNKFVSVSVGTCPVTRSPTVLSANGVLPCRAIRSTRLRFDGLMPNTKGWSGFCTTIITNKRWRKYNILW